MLRFTIKNVAPFDGDHDFDVEKPFTGDELHLIKEVSGVRLGEINDALAAGDYDLIVAFATLALIRTGRVQARMGRRTVDLLRAADVEAIDVEDLGDGDDAVPPPVKPSEPKKPAGATES